MISSKKSNIFLPSTSSYLSHTSTVQKSLQSGLEVHYIHIHLHRRTLINTLEGLLHDFPSISDLQQTVKTDLIPYFRITTMGLRFK